MKGKKMPMKPEKKLEGEMKAHHSGKGTRARLNTAAEKAFFGGKKK